MTFLLAAKGRRTVAALGAVSAGLLVLSACEKPTPMTTMTFGDDTVSAEATCYDEGKGFSREKAVECALKKSKKSVKVSQGETMRIGVDPEVSDSGWTVWVNGQQVISPNPFKKTFRSFPGIDVFAPQQDGKVEDKLYISVVQQNEAGTKFKGVWNFKLVNDDA
ncbi:hypothetical protein U9R90_30335 [Streptomyces sp. E11-3]|uniref:hypothetical protein n=1 Tax=Streptomyces sp. E11-3 TaxID=3110112 RepID=UPI003980606B